MRYLNSEGIDKLSILGVVSGLLLNFKKIIDKQQWSAETRRTVSQATTWTDKAYLAIISELDQKQQNTLFNRLKSLRSAKLDIIRDNRTAAETVEIEKDDFYDMISHIIAGGCQNCRNPKDCQFKELLLKYDVPINSSSYDCPYWNDRPEPISDVGLKLVKAGAGA